MAHPGTKRQGDRIPCCATQVGITRQDRGSLAVRASAPSESRIIRATTNCMPGSQDPGFFLSGALLSRAQQEDTNLRSCWTGHSPRPHTRLVEARECRSKTVDSALGEIDFVWGRGFAPPKVEKTRRKGFMTLGGAKPRPQTKTISTHAGCTSLAQSGLGDGRGLRACDISQNRRKR